MLGTRTGGPATGGADHCKGTGRKSESCSDEDDRDQRAEHVDSLPLGRHVRPSRKMSPGGLKTGSPDAQRSLNDVFTAGQGKVVSVLVAMLTFRLLGTLEVEGAETELGSGKQRALLAYLLLRRNQAVPRDVLIDALWGDDPPETAAHALDVDASRLRRSLGDPGILEGRRGSFVLNVPDESVDVGRFEQFLAEMRGTADPEARLRAADAGLDPLAR